MFLVGDWESVRRPVGVISLGTSQPFVVLYSWEDGELHGATVSSGTSETEIRSKGSEQRPGASKATDNPPMYFNVLNSKSRTPNATKPQCVGGRKEERLGMLVLWAAAATGCLPHKNGQVAFDSVMPPCRRK